MTTRMNNMFYQRGMSFGMSFAKNISKDCKSIAEFEERIDKFIDRNLKHINDNCSNFTIESEFVVTDYFDVTVNNGEYTLTNMDINSRCWIYILWEEDTNTNHIVTIIGDNKVFEFVDRDDNFIENIAKAIGCKGKLKVLEVPKHIEIAE